MINTTAVGIDKIKLGDKMNNLYLTSHGLNKKYNKHINAYPKIIKMFYKNKVAIIPNAKLITEDRSSTVNIISDLNKNNIIGELFDLDIKRSEELDNFDAIYICGGEPKYLMDSIYNNDFHNKIIEFIRNGKTIVGESAGAMIFNKEYLDYTSGSLIIRNNGFDFYSKIIVPHYDYLSDNIKRELPKNILKIKDLDGIIKI